MTDIEAVLAKAREHGYRRTETVDLFDPALIEQHADLQLEMAATIEADSLHNRKPQAPEVAQRVRDLEAEIGSSATKLRFGALSYRAWTDLLARHAPTKKQLQEVADKASSWRDRQVLDHNPDTFPPALVAACAIDPEMTDEQATELAENLGPVQFEMLYQACIRINRTGDTAPKSEAAGSILQLSERFAGTAVREGSLAELS